MNLRDTSERFSFESDKKKESTLVINESNVFKRVIQGSPKNIT